MSRRVLVQLGGARERAVSLEGALELAARLQGELLGLFVQDERVLRSAALPFLRQVGHFSGEEEDFDTGRAERELRALAARARRELEQRAGARRVGCSFQVLSRDPRRPADERESPAVGAADIVVVTGVARRAPPGFAGCSVLSLRTHLTLSTPLAVVPECAEAADAALELAARLADERHPVVVFLPSDHGVEDAPRPVEQQRLGPIAIARALREARGGLLVVRDGAGAAFEHLLDALDLPVLAVAPPAS